MKPEDLMTYCGWFCGSCARYSRSTAFRDAARPLAEVDDGYGFQHGLPQTDTDFDSAEFRKGLDFFANPDSWLFCQHSCRGDPVGPP